MKKKTAAFVAFVLCLLFVCPLCGCGLSSDDILSVREGAEKMRRKLSETFMEGFRARDTNAVKASFCPKTQRLPGIDAQIEKSFAFLDGNVADYTVSKDIGGESYGSNYGTVTDYTFYNDIFITADTGKQYTLVMKILYVVEGDRAEDSIRGMTWYNLVEQTDDWETRKICHTGYDWSTPYDVEYGLLAVRLIHALAGGDAATLQTLLCPEIAQAADTAAQTEKIFAFFAGNPLFAERADGLYAEAETENDFTCSALGYDCTADKNGNHSGVWVHVLASPIVTDGGRTYELDFVAYMRRDDMPQRKGISFISLKDDDTEEKTELGEWLHDDTTPKKRVCGIF